MTKAKTTSTSKHVDIPEENIVSLNIEQFLMPFAVIFASLVLGVSMYASAAKISNGTYVNSQPTIANNAPAVPGIEEEGPQFVQVSVDDDAIKGNIKKAKVGIVEFSDYECPFCKRFYDDTMAQIISEYVDSNDVVFTFRDLPLAFHPFAQKQAEAAECAGEQGKYFDMHDYIFENGGQLSEDALKAAAKEIGLNSGKFDSCLDNGDMVDEVAADAADAAKAGINGTPGFVVGPIDKDGNVDGQVISGALPFESFKAVIDSYLE